MHAIIALTQQFKSEVSAVNKRDLHIESKMGNFASTFNELVDAHDRDDEIYWIKTKMADLEDRARRNNVKIRGIPESIYPPDLKMHFMNLLKDALPEAPLEELIIDRFHRLPKPKHIPSHLPRDTLARIHFYHQKKKKNLCRSLETVETFQKSRQDI